MLRVWLKVMVELCAIFFALVMCVMDYDDAGTNQGMVHALFHLNKLLFSPKIADISIKRTMANGLNPGVSVVCVPL